MIDLRCRSGKTCVARTSDGAALTSQPTLCHGCITDIQKRLTELPHLAAALNTFKGTWGGVSYEARVTGSKEPPIPLNVGALDLIDEIGDVIDRAGGYRVIDLITLAAEDYIVWRRGERQAVDLDGVMRALDIRRVHTKAESMVGLNRVWQRRAAACPNCHLPTLGSWLGDEQILCTNGDCLSAFTRTAYEEACIEQSRNEKGKKR